MGASSMVMATVPLSGSCRIIGRQAPSDQEIRTRFMIRLLLLGPLLLGKYQESAFSNSPMMVASQISGP
jgi:hypothetical protein